MDARATTEQLELAAVATRLADRFGPSTVGDLDDLERRGRLEAALHQAGWRELRTGTASEPMASGVEAAMVARALAKRVCDVSFIGPVLAHDLLRRVDSPSATDGVQRTVAVERGLEQLATGNGIAVDSAGRTAAVMFDGDSGELIDVPVGTDQPAGGVDLTRAVCPVAAAAAPTIVHGRLAADGLLAWEALAATLTAADLVGTMEGALDLTADYAKQREQYGVPIGSFQAVQHLLAEAKTLTEGALSALFYAAWAVDALPPAEARAAAAVAKAYAARGARTVCETAIQVHGGIGNTWECMAHVFLRRALLSTELFGGDGAQLALLSAGRWGATNGLS